MFEQIFKNIDNLENDKKDFFRLIRRDYIIEPF